MEIDELIEKGQNVKESLFAELKLRIQADFLTFQQFVVIPSAYGPQRLGECQAIFQKEAFEAMAPSLEAIRLGKMPEKKRFWLERTKKASKDADLAVCILWLMAYTKRPFLAQICASDSKQAKIIRDRCVEVIHYNPWLNDLVEVIEDQVRNRANPRTVRTIIESTGSAGDAQGPTPDLLILNELVHVERWATIEAHRANAAGVPMNVTIIATNAGVQGSPAHAMRADAIKSDRFWTQFYQDRAPWVSEEDVDEIRATDPTGKEVDRLFKGVWISGLGDAVDEHDIARIFCLDGPTLQPEDGWFYIVGLDMGETHDHAGLMVVGVEIEEAIIKVCRFMAFRPSVDNGEGKLEVDCNSVERTALEWIRKYNACWLGYDPAAGGRFVAQWLRKHGVPTYEMSFSSSKNLTDMATYFIQAVKEGRLKSYDDEKGTLRRDIGKFSIERTLRGRRLTATRDAYGHADVGTALIICVPQAFELMGWANAHSGGHDISDIENGPLTQKEIDDMDPNLRDIYELKWTKMEN